MLAAAISKSMLLLFFYVPSLFADAVVLKDGQRVEGQIVHNGDGHVKIDIAGVTLTYFYADIRHLEMDDAAFAGGGASGDILSKVGGGTDSGAENWIRRHHGVIFYQDYPSDRYDMGNLVSLGQDLGSRSAKTWLKGDAPNDIPQRAQQSPYKNLFDSFDVIALNVCPDYMLRRWDQRRSFDATTRQDIESDFYQLVKFLIDAYNGRDKIFIINYFFELNVYAGTAESKRPQFPVVDFISQAQRGVKRAMAEATLENLRILDCVEANCDHGHFSFVKTYFPQIRTDLYSLSYYGDGPIRNYLSFWAKHAPDNDLFGSKNVMVGEYGIRLEDGRVRNSEQAQAQYLESVRQQAQDFGVPFMFVFWLADQNSKVSGEGSFGLVDLKGRKRESWHALYAAYR